MPEAKLLFCRPNEFSPTISSNKNKIATPVKVRNTGFGIAVPLIVHFTSLFILGK